MVLNCYSSNSYVTGWVIYLDTGLNDIIVFGSCSVFGNKIDIGIPTSFNENVHLCKTEVQDALETSHVCNSVGTTHSLIPGFTFSMKSGSKNGWHSIVPLCLRGKTVAHFCMFPKVKSAGYGAGNAPVYLNVYDLTPINGYVYWAGIGIFHSGVEVHGVEYAFGAHDYPTSGVFEVDPRQCPSFKFRKSIFMGTTCLDPFQVREFMERQSANYNGDMYHLIVKNCNHFCADICYKLTGNRVPKWVNRLARIGSFCNCILPETLKASTVQHDPNSQGYDNEKKRLRSAFSCLSSISMNQKEVSMSSLFLHSHYKGCLPPWELKRSRNRSLKEG